MPGNSTAQPLTLSADKTKDSVLTLRLTAANNGYQYQALLTSSCGSAYSDIATISLSTPPTPTLTGLPLRSLCPDSTLRLVATGCTADVKWSYTLKTTTGTLATTNDTLSLTYNTLLLAAWSAGDTLALTAACTLPNCGASQPSTTVKVVKQASCTISTALADCAFYLKAADAQGTETTKLTRTGAGGSIFQLLTLSAQTLEGTSPTGVTYSWTGPGITTPLTTAQISATQVGEYKLTLSSPTGGGQVGVCELYITLSGAPCTIPTSAACGIPANITPSDQGGPYLTSLAPGDQFTANDYVITVTSVINSPLQQGEGQGVRFSGEGYARMKLTNGFSIDVPVVFGQSNGATNTPIGGWGAIKLNTCYQLVDGTVVTQYDPSWGNIADVQSSVRQFVDIQQEITDLLNSYSGTQGEKNLIETKIQELEQFKSELAASQQDVELINALTLEANELDEYASCKITDPAAAGRIAACSYVPWVKVAQCLGAAAFNVFISYTFKYLELKLDNAPKDFTDFQGITSQMNWTDVTTSALLSCAFSLIPIPTGKGTAIIIAGGAATAATEAFANSIISQWNQLSPQYSSMSETYDHLSWQNATAAAAQAGLTTAITMGLTTLAKHPSVKSFTDKVIKKINTRGITATRNLLSSVLPEAEIDAFLRRIGKNVRSRWQGEGKFGTFRALGTDFNDNFRKQFSGTNFILSAHHIPSAAFMESLQRGGFISGWTRAGGTCIQLEAIRNGLRNGADRHSRTATYFCGRNCPDYSNMTPSQVLQAEVEELIQILERDNIYNSYFRSQLQQLVDQTHNTYPTVFNSFVVR